MVIKKWGKWTNGFFAKIARHYLRQEGRRITALSCTRSVLATKVLGPTQPKPGKTMKIVVSAEIAENQKWHLFLKRVFFGMFEQVDFTNCKFGSCLWLKTLFYCVFGKTQHLQKKCMLKIQRLWKLWVVFEHGKTVFLFRCFVAFLVCGGWSCGVCFLAFWRS